MKPIFAEALDRVILLISRSSTMSRWLFSFMLFNLKVILRITAVMHPSFKKRLMEKSFTAQIKTRDNTVGRYFTFTGGRIISKSGLHPKPDIVISYHSAALGTRLMTPWHSQMEQISAMKNFQIGIEGPDELTSWFAETLSLILTIGLEYGIDVGNGVKRYVSGTNGGPVFVYVKDGKVIRITPIDFINEDADPWTIEARGKKFTPSRRTTISPYSLALKSMIYSPDRLLYPMKRVDFDPKGERNHRNRGISGYERISWDDALDIVADEIKRAKREHGPGAIMNGSSSHHLWGILGYWLSARHRFFNSIGWTPVEHNPDSWEGWYWGATHHWGNTSNHGV